MKELYEKLKVDINYEKQSFDDMNVNLYEIVVAASKKAREVNDMIRKYVGSDFDVQPRNIAMKKIEGIGDGNVELSYIEEEKEAGNSPGSDEKS